MDHKASNAKNDYKLGSSSVDSDIEQNGRDGKVQKVDNVELSIHDKLQKLKSLGSTRKELTAADREPDRKREYSGKEKEISVEDVALKTENLPSSSSLVKARQPLLSKRSKKQLMNLGNEERSFSQEDLSGRYKVLLKALTYGI